MLEIFIQGLLLGFGVSVPFGPVNILILSYALKSFKNAFSVGLGAMSADILYLLLLAFGLLGFLNNEIFKQILAVFGFVFLSYMAFSMLKNKAKALKFKEEKVQESTLKSFIKGFSLNLLNPYVIGFWLSISLLVNQNNNPWIMLFGLFIAISIWIFALSFFVGKFAYLFSAKVVLYINIISAFIIEYFALAMLYKTFM